MCLYLQWQRASAIRKRAQRLLGSAQDFHGSAIWSVKRIMIWCRAHSYTPLDKGKTYLYFSFYWRDSDVPQPFFRILGSIPGPITHFI